MRNIASILVSNFRKWGINNVFGVPGRPLASLIMELDRQDINFILSKHESGAGYSAAGYSLMNRKLGIALVTSGPGGTNALTAAGQAKAYHIPVIFITGQQSMHNVGKAIGQDSTIFGTDLVRMFESVTKFSARVERADQFQILLKHALEKAYSGVKGPVHLSIPLDILNEEIDEFELDLPNNMDKLISSRLDEFVSKLNNARKPVILAGKGIHSSLAYEEVKNIAEIWDIPVMTTPGGKGTFAENHPLSLGSLGLGGTDKSSEYIKEDADLMIVIGSKLSDMSLVGISSDNYPKEVVHLDYEQTFIEKALPVQTLPIIGDIKANLQLVLDKAKDRRRSEYTLLEENYEFKNNMKENNKYLSSAHAMKIIRKVLPDDAVVFGDDGSHSFYAIRYFNIKKPGTFFFDDVFGAMGHAIGYSIGAQLANCNSRIICITGDGCTFMQGAEISTAANYNIPVTFIVINNGRLDMPEKAMIKFFGKTVGTNYNVPLNGKKFGESLGVKSYRCCNETELIEALEISNLHKEAILIEVMVDPNEIPPTMKRG